MQAQNTAMVNISKKQAHAFAVAVFADIRAYRETHQAEFEEFLMAEQEEGGTDNEEEFNVSCKHRNSQSGKGGKYTSLENCP